MGVNCNAVDTSDAKDLLLLLVEGAEEGLEEGGHEMFREPSKEEHLNAQTHESEDDDCSDNHPNDFSGFTRAHENLTLSITA
jgi:hypothetical protein